MPTLTLKDFGPIAEASIDLKPLTVFMGPNGTGKSYAALAWYALSRSVQQIYPAVIESAQVSETPRPNNANVTTQSIQTVQALLEFLRWAIASDNSDFPPFEFDQLPESVQAAYVTALKSYAYVFEGRISTELQRCYGTDVPKLARRNASVAQKSFDMNFEDASSVFYWEAISNQNGIATRKGPAQLSSILVGAIEAARSQLSSLVLSEAQNFDQIMERYILGFFGTLHGNVLPTAHYLPASRSGFMLGHRAFASLLVGRSSLAWVEPIEIPRLPGAVTDLIQILLNLDERNEDTHEKITETVRFLEANVTHGTVDVDPGQYPEVYFEDDTGKYQMHQASSTVSEIAPLVLFLKYRVQPGDLLIIEEPESHLDATNQTNMARALARLVNAGVKVLVTTHSDFFVKQINNLIQLTGISHQQRTAMKYKKQDVVDPANVGAYLFKPGTDGTNVESMEVTGAYGIDTTEFTEVHRDLYDEALKLEYAPR